MHDVAHPRRSAEGSENEKEGQEFQLAVGGPREPQARAEVNLNWTWRTDAAPVGKGEEGGPLTYSPFGWGRQR